MAAHKKMAKDRAAHGRYKAEGRDRKNRIRKYQKKIKQALKIQARAILLGRKTRVDKVIAELETAMKKAGG